MDIVALYIGSYLLGSIPTAYLIGRMVKGVDIRGYGSGNVGSANLYEHVGKRWVYPVAAVEIFVKGALPIVVAIYVLDISRSSAYLIGPGLLTLAGNNWQRPVVLCVFARPRRPHQDSRRTVSSARSAE